VSAFSMSLHRAPRCILVRVRPSKGSALQSAGDGTAAQARHDASAADARGGEQRQRPGQISGKCIGRVLRLLTRGYGPIGGKVRGIILSTAAEKFRQGPMLKPGARTRASYDAKV
jgi:hypothetical protein